MLTYQTETFADVKGEAHALIQAHWDETEAAMYGAQEYTLDEGKYRTLEGLDMLHIVTARDAGGSLSGYAAFALCPCPHRHGVTLAALDGLYLAPRWRKGLGVLEMLRHAEKALSARGVGMVQYSSPASRPCDALYRRLGAAHTETIWHKDL